MLTLFYDPETKKLIALPIKNLYLLENCIPPSLSDSIHENPPPALILFKPEQMWHTTPWVFYRVQIIA